MIPWNEKVPLLSVHPDTASRQDIARLATEYMELRAGLCNIVSNTAVYGEIAGEYAHELLQDSVDEPTG